MIMLGSRGEPGDRWYMNSMLNWSLNSLWPTWPLVLVALSLWNCQAVAPWLTADLLLTMLYYCCWPRHGTARPSCAPQRRLLHRCPAPAARPWSLPVLARQALTRPPPPTCQTVDRQTGPLRRSLVLPPPRPQPPRARASGSGRPTARRPGPRPWPSAASRPSLSEPRPSFPPWHATIRPARGSNNILGLSYTCPIHLTTRHTRPPHPSNVSLLRELTARQIVPAVQMAHDIGSVLSGQQPRPILVVDMVGGLVALCHSCRSVYR